MTSNMKEGKEGMEKLAKQREVETGTIKGL
jgi:hypothetical protein